MTKQFIKESIGSYKTRMKHYQQMAKEAIEECQYSTAADCIVQAAKCEGAIEELEFILEEWEVYGE